MAEVHQRMKQLADHDDPLMALAERIAESTRLLCLDEFHVDDIADAMILGRLLSALFERGVVLITTSNYPPSGLYPHGLQRQNFLPAIAMLERELQVLNLGNGDDYRQQGGDKEPRYIVPADAHSERLMGAMFDRLNDDMNEARHHPIPHKRIAAHAIWFDFAELCSKAHGQSDYLHIAQRFRTVFCPASPSCMPTTPLRLAVSLGSLTCCTTTMCNWSPLPKPRRRNCISKARVHPSSVAPPAA